MKSKRISGFVISNSVRIRNIIVNVRVKSSYPVMLRVFSQKFAFSLVVLFIEPNLPIAQSNARKNFHCVQHFCCSLSLHKLVYTNLIRKLHFVSFISIIFVIWSCTRTFFLCPFNYSVCFQCTHAFFWCTNNMTKL